MITKSVRPTNHESIMTVKARYKTVTARYKTVNARYQTVNARCKTVKARYKTAIARCKTVKARYTTFKTRNKTVTAEDGEAGVPLVHLVSGLQFRDPDLKCFSNSYAPIIRFLVKGVQQSEALM